MYKINCSYGILNLIGVVGNLGVKKDVLYSIHLFSVFMNDFVHISKDTLFNFFCSLAMSSYLRTPHERQGLLITVLQTIETCNTRFKEYLASDSYYM